MEVMVKAVVWLWPLTVLAKGGEWPIVGRGGGRGHGELVGQVDGGGYLCVGQCGVHAGDVQVAAVVRPLTPLGRHEGRHPAAVGVAQGLALLCAVGEQVSTCSENTGRGMEGKWKRGKVWRDGKVDGRLQIHEGPWEEKAVWKFEVETQDGGGDERKRPEERTWVSNHLPVSQAEKVQQKLFIKETRPTLMKRIVCFPPHLIHSEWNVQSQWCGVAKTFHLLSTSTSSDSQLIPKHHQTENVNPYSVILTQKNYNYLKKCTTKTNKIFTCCLITLWCQSSLYKPTKCVIDTELVPKKTST